MELRALSRYMRFCAGTWLTVFGLAAAEHHGLVKFGSVPVSGATVTASQGDKKVVTVTDKTGAYSLADLEDGVWKIQVEMLGFSTAAKEIAVTSNAPSSEWDLKLLSADEIKSKMQAAPAGSAAPATSTAAAVAPATPGNPTPAPVAVAAPAGSPTGAVASAKPPAKGARNGKGTPAQTPAASFQRTDLNAAGDGGGAAASSPPSLASADATQTADAFVVNGSSTNGIQRAAIGNARRGPRSLFNGGANFALDNSVLNARSYSLVGLNTPQTPQNNFRAGVNFGGPVAIPHVLRWQNANFFFNYQINRQRSAPNGIALMPNGDERKGDFSQVPGPNGGPITLLDPTTGLPIPNAMIPPPQISKEAKDRRKNCLTFEE